MDAIYAYDDREQAVMVFPFTFEVGRAAASINHQD